MKRYEFSFITKIKFGNSISNQHFMLRCLPGNYQFQRVYDEAWAISPVVNCTVDEDSFGNKTLSGSINEVHDFFEYKINGKVMLSKYKSAEALDRMYLYETPSTRISEEMREFASNIEKSNSIGQKAFQVCNAVFSALKYKPGSTSTKTSAADAFRQNMGVCQDFAQITIAILRHLGIPARYCVGFMEGEGETHAWVEYYDGNTWYGIDPTHDRSIEYGYIKVSHGRDAHDCSVDRGCFSARSENVEQNIQISVKVGEINA